MMIRVVVVGAVRGPLAELLNDFEARARRYWRLEIVEVKAGAKGSSDPSVVVKAEAERIDKHLRPGAKRWILSREGKSMSSTGLTHLLERAGVNGEEVDFVIESKGKLIAIEVKATSSPRLSDAKYLGTFRDEYGDSVHGCLLLHGGSRFEVLAPGILALPWWSVI